MHRFGIESQKRGSLISIFSLNFAEFLLDLTNFSRDFPKMQQFWENPKIAHLIFVLEMRTLNFRFEKHLIFIFTNI